MWKDIYNDKSVWVLLTYALVRGNHEWQAYADITAGLIGLLVITRLYRQHRA